MRNRRITISSGIKKTPLRGGAFLDHNQERPDFAFPFLRSSFNGDLENIGVSDKYRKEIVCPDGCVMFRLSARSLGNENCFKGKFFDAL